jgi:hypothetical protein
VWRPYMANTGKKGLYFSVACVGERGAGASARLWRAATFSLSLSLCLSLSLEEAPPPAAPGPQLTGGRGGAEGVEETVNVCVCVCVCVYCMWVRIALCVCCVRCCDMIRWGGQILLNPLTRSAPEKKKTYNSGEKTRPRVRKRERGLVKVRSEWREGGGHHRETRAPPVCMALPTGTLA